MSEREAILIANYSAHDPDMLGQCDRMMHRTVQRVEINVYCLQGAGCGSRLRRFKVNIDRNYLAASLMKISFRDCRAIGLP